MSVEIRIDGDRRTFELDADGNLRVAWAPLPAASLGRRARAGALRRICRLLARIVARGRGTARR